MDFEFTPEQDELRRAVRAVLENECPKSLVRDVVETGAVPEQPWKSAGELGWAGVRIPERFGGLGLGFEELAVVVEEHGRALAPGPFLATVTQFLPVVLESGSDAQRERLLPPLAAGERTGALAIGNASGAGLAPDASLCARREGAGFVLEGSRHFVLDGDTADEIAVVARVDEGDGCALFAIPGAWVKSERVESLDASRSIATLTFDRVTVEPARVLGTPGACAPALGRGLEEATTALALETVGVCRALFELVLAHVRDRVQFGQPIGAFQAVQHKCADLFIAVEKARSTGYFAAMTLGEDDPRRALAASMAKVAVGECQRLLCKEAIQLHGGIGFTWESDVHLYVKRARTGEALLGTAREHRAEIARRVIG